MQAIIFADRNGQELAPLNKLSCPALLPLANRPLLEYTLDDLALADIDEVLIVVSRHANQIEAHFGNGEMWGMHFHYLLSRGEELPEQLLQRFASRLAPSFLALRGDLLRPALCRNFMKKSDVHQGPAIEARIDGHSAGLYLVRQVDVALPGLAWPPTTHAGQSEQLSEQSIEFSGGLFSRLQNLAEFHATSLGLLDEHKDTAMLAGRKIDDELTVGRLTQVPSSSCDGGTVLIGDKSNVDASARLSGPLIIGHRCFIDRGAKLRNSVILPDTYVGEGLEVDNAIVLGHHLIRVDRNSHIHIEDPLLLSNMDHEIRSLLAPLPERFLGILFLLLSFPLWLIALTATRLQTSGKLFRQRTLVSNRVNTNVANISQHLVLGWQFATTIPILRSLPMLWLVAKGDLRLFGSEPISQNGRSSPSPCWDVRRESGAAGLLGPAQLALPVDAPEEEIRLNEAVFLQHNGLGTLCLRLCQALALLFSTRAWRATDQTGEESLS